MGTPASSSSPHSRRDPNVSFLRHVELLEAIKSGKRDRARDAVDAVVKASMQRAVHES